MSRKSILQTAVFSMIWALFLGACGAVQPAATAEPIPTATQVPTDIPFTPLAEGRIIFEKPDGKKFIGTIYGQGETAIILGNMAHDGEAQWDPFVKAVDKQKFTVVTYLRLGTDDASIIEETKLILQQFRNRGYHRAICIGASVGVHTCGSIASEPEMIGIALIAATDGNNQTFSPIALDQIMYPKLFISGDKDAATAETQTMYEEASEPKSLIIFEKEAMHGTRLFFSPNHSEEFLKQLLDFVNNLP